MNLSFSELEALSRKAARGAGLSWGLAEEAGTAVRRLAEQGLAGPEALAAHLPNVAARDYDALRPQLGSARWRPTGDALCPLITGVTLSDHAGLLPDMLTLGPVWHPLLLLPFVVRSANRLGQPLAVDWQDAQVICGKTGVEASGDLNPALTRTVMITRAGHWPEARPLSERRAIDAAVLEILDRFAHKTYVEASDASRLAGAGAGVQDND